MKYADLHIHTNFSDGTFTPEEVVNRAHKAGFSCIAITDHDAVGAIAPALREGQSLGVEVIPGVELTAEIEKYEIHILGYCIDWQAGWFQEKLKSICRVRRERALTILERLRKQGIDLDADELLGMANSTSIGRLHIARMLEKKGFVRSIQEAFNKYIGNGSACYVKKFKLTPAEAIAMVCKLNGVAVLAHPYYIGNDGLIPAFIQSGLRGIEAYYSEYNSATSKHYRDLARKYGLLATGGSDCHGLGKDRVMLGEVKVPYEAVEALKKEAGLIKSGRR